MHRVEKPLYYEVLQNLPHTSNFKYVLVAKTCTYEYLVAKFMYHAFFREPGTAALYEYAIVCGEDTISARRRESAYHAKSCI